MQAGERYQVPTDADNPMINVGRPDKLEVRLNDTLQPPLGDGSRALKDIGVSSAAVKARQQPGTGTAAATGGRRHGAPAKYGARKEERSVGKEGVSTVSSRGGWYP